MTSLENSMAPSAESVVAAWKLIRITALVGFLTLILAGLAIASFPSTAKLSDGFFTPIVALEFAKTPEDVAFLTGKDSQAIEMRNKMRSGQKVDMVFPFAYGGLLALTLLCLARAGVKFAWFGLVFAVGVVGCEMWENLIIADMLTALDQAQPVSTLLLALSPAIWSKWWCLAASAGFIGIAAFTQKMPWTGGLGVLTFVALALTWFTDARPIVAEIMALISTVFLTFLSVRAIIIAKKASRLQVVKH
jgi:hypothetical protein